MTWKRMVMELGMGTDIRGSDYTKAATRAVHNALRQNSLVVADAFGKPRDEMRVDIHIGVQEPDSVDRQAVAEMLPYGSGRVEVVKGGMDTPKDDGTVGTIMANAALLVYLDLPDEQDWIAK
ncbi:MAG: Lin0512 family protein [Pseudomonadota bacterium]